MTLAKMNNRSTRLRGRVGWDGDAKIYIYHAEVPVKGAVKLGGSGLSRKLEAGESYLVKFEGHITPVGCVPVCKLHPEFSASGVCESTRVFTPAEGKQTLDFVFICMKNLDLGSLEYGCQLFYESEAPGRWK